MPLNHLGVILCSCRNRYGLQGETKNLI